ncbi:MAG: RDD family protein [Dehalococcoidia bacterium]|nr:RDD family protein [Dehalococcoidia bacterium]
MFVSPRRVPLAVAGPGARTGAAAADVFLYVVASPFALGASAVVLRAWWPLGALAIALAYLVLGWAGGQTPGMRLTHTRMVALRTAQEPGVGRALVRALLVLPQAVAAFLLADSVFAAGSLPSEDVFVAASLTVLLAGAVDQAWALFDPLGRALHDRVAGVVILDVAPAPAESRPHP